MELAVGAAGLRARGRAARCAARTSSRWKSRRSCSRSRAAIATSIGYARDGDDACVALLRIRGGKLLAREQQFLENIDGEDDADVLDAYLAGELRRHAGASADSCCCRSIFADRELIEQSLRAHEDPRAAARAAARADRPGGAERASSARGAEARRRWRRRSGRAIPSTSCSESSGLQTVAALPGLLRHLARRRAPTRSARASGSRTGVRSAPSIASSR